MAEDLYSILGVSRDANEQEIKRAYRRLAQKYHPDRHKGDKEAEKKFKEINGAYQILSDQQKRRQYDQFGTFEQRGDFSGGFQGGGFDFSSFGGSFSDIFETFFGQGEGMRRKKESGKTRGRDIEAEIELRFEEAAFGTEKKLNVRKMTTCERCKGSGSEPGAKEVSCPTCHGSGQLRSIQQTILGQIVTSRTCSHCRGEGKIPEKICTMCQGETRVRREEEIKVKIPAGIDNNSTIRLSAKGEAGMKGGNFGDLYLHIKILPNKEFSRKGFDVYSEYSIDLLRAVLGDEVEVKTLHGPYRLAVMPGTQSDKLFKIKGKGIPHFRAEGIGDHYVKIVVQIPTKLGKKEKELYEALAQTRGISVKSPKKGWIF